MMNDHAFEKLVRDALDRKGLPPPFSIDVTDHVMARVAAMGAPPRTEMDLRQFGKWAAAAAVVGVALTAAAVWQAPSLAGAVSVFLHTMAESTGAALKLTGPAGSLAGALGRVALALVASAQALAQPLEPLKPLAHAMLAATAAGMAIITTFVVGRDIRVRVAEKEQA